MKWEDDVADEERGLADVVGSGQDVKQEAIDSPLTPDSPSLKEEQFLADADSDQKRSSSSRQASLSLDSPKGATKPLPKGPTQYATHLPRGESKALKTFERLKANWYQNSKVGRSRGHKKEAMVCECRYRYGIDDPAIACSEDADCINRLTQVECLKAECNCREHCQNQRFERGEYADVEVIETEKKGFGLRAGSTIAA